MVTCKNNERMSGTVLGFNILEGMYWVRSHSYPYHWMAKQFDFQVTIDDLIPGSRYKFRIKAENCYGISDPGDESDSFDVAPGER